jgi:hypothetical protein
MASLNLKGCMVIDDDFEGYPKVTKPFFLKTLFPAKNN